jgi:hypothetical protein
MQKAVADSFHADIAAGGNASHDHKEQHMDLYTIQEYARIRQEERLKWAASKYGELQPSLIWRGFAFIKRAIRVVLSVRVSLVIRTQPETSRRALTEPDMCIE